MTCFGEANGEHLQGVMRLLFFQVIISPEFFCGHLSLVYRRPLSFQGLCHLLKRDLFSKLFLKRDECAVYGCVRLWDRRFVVTPLFPLPATSLTSHMLCIIYAPVPCASEHS